MEQISNIEIDNLVDYALSIVENPPAELPIREIYATSLSHTIIIESIFRTMPRKEQLKEITRVAREFRAECKKAHHRRIARESARKNRAKNRLQRFLKRHPKWNGIIKSDDDLNEYYAHRSQFEFIMRRKSPTGGSDPQRRDNFEVLKRILIQ